MTVTYSLYCHDLKLKLWVGQGYGGMTNFYTGEKHLDKLSKFLLKTSNHLIILLSDLSEGDEFDDYKEFMEEGEKASVCGACGNPVTDGHVYFHIKTNVKIFLCEVCAENHKLNGYDRESSEE